MIEKNTKSFTPVLLGSDANVYGMARAFHEEYGIPSLAISKTILTATVDSKIIHFNIEPDLENPEVFLKTLLDVKALYKDRKLLLVPCGDGYVKLVVQFQEELKEHYHFNCLSADLLRTLTLKESFYEVCDKYGFSFPKTQIITAQNYSKEKVDIEFPVIIKASNSVEYWNCKFEGKMKVFIAQNQNEYDDIMKAIYSSSYQDNMTIQEFIPGDDSYMRVLNCYVGSDGKVKLMALGHALLEDHTPQGIGSYVAIINMYDKEILDQFKEFLEGIGYRGFANFDMKYDMRDGKYKFFETNVRQGRSSFYVTASGFNLAKYLADDVIFNRKQSFTIARNEHLWLQVPLGIVYKYVKDPELNKKIKMLVKSKSSTNSLFYKEDMCLKRYIKLKLSMYNYYKKYKKYYGKKSLNI